MNLQFSTKNKIIELTNSWFESNGYKFDAHGYAHGYGKYIRDEDDWICSIKFTFYSQTDNHANSTLFMHSKEVEKIILEIGLPNMNLENYKNGKLFLSTIQDKRNIEKYKVQRDKLDLTKEKDMIIWANQIIEYMSREGQAFYDKYKDIANINSELLSLENEGNVNYLNILSGGIDHIFRALIVSKLSNSEKYEKRVEHWNEIVLSNDKYKMWHPYFQRLVDKLRNMD